MGMLKKDGKPKAQEVDEVIYKAAIRSRSI